MNLKQMEQGVELILKGMGCDLSESHFTDTPKRVAKMYKEMLTPEPNNWTQFPAVTGGMILLRGHKVYALCPHHLLPVELRAYVAYIPKKRVLGLSKLARVVHEHLTRPIVQEELCKLVADQLDDVLEPQGVGVVLAGEHGCMKFRGVLTDGDVVTTEVRGLFMHSQATRDELMRLIGRP